MGFFDNLTVNNLDSFSFIAGTVQILRFNVVDGSGNGINVSGADCGWLMSPLGQPNIITLNKDATPAGTPNNQFSVTLTSADTLTLSGKYIQQPVLLDLGGSAYRVGQGIINIIPAIN